jgi:photosystem II stability/assembly factor-like uncharacterized protein
MGQLFHTTSSGSSWSEVDFRQIQSSHETRVQFTENPQILYSLDYTDPNGSGAVTPTRSTDGGQTWHQIASDPTSGGADRLFADPQNHNIVLVSDYTNLYVSTDGGTTWANKYSNSNGGQGLHLAGAYFDGSNIDVGTNSDLLVSSNGGASFSLSSVGGIAAGSVMMSFSGAKQGTTTRFFAVTWNSADVYAGVQGYDYSGIAAGSATVYSYTLGQPSWTLAMTGISSSVVPIYVGSALNDVNTAYVAGGSNPSGDPTIYKTTDGGAHWTSVFQTVGNQNISTGWQGSGGDRGWSYGEVALGLAVDPSNSSDVVMTDLGFAHETTNGGTSWNQLYVIPADQNPSGAATPKGKAYAESGLDNTTAWGVNWVDSSDLLVANSDIIGTHSSDGGQTFAFATAGNNYNSTYMTVTAPGTGIVYAATSSIHDMYQSTHLTDSSIDGGSGAVLFSTTKGATWQTLHNFGKPVVWVVTDPTNPNRLYASVVNSASGGIYVTNDLQDGSSSVWTKLTNPPRTQGHPFDIRVLNDGSLVVSFSGRRAGSPQNFTNSSGVFLSTDGGQTWSDRSSPNMLYWTTDVVIDPSDSSQNTWYAGVFSGWGGAANNLGGLFRTTDRGLHWTQISTLTRVSSITINPNDPTEAFLTTETDGLWYSSNIQAANPTFTQVASYPFRQPERVFYNPYQPNQIFVTSFGSGVMVGSTLTAPTVTWPSPAPITYGTPLSATQLDATANVPGTFVYTPALGAVLNAGAADTLSVTFTPTDTADYSSVTTTTTIQVLKAHLTVTASNATKTYGASLPTFSDTITGFVNNDPPTVVSGSPSLSTTATASSAVGTYPINASVGTLTAANYDFVFAPGSLTVTRAHLTVAADNKSRVAGASNPTLTATITGFVNGDTGSAVTGAPSLATSAITSSPPGSYPITVAIGSLSAANYDFPTLVNGTLTVTASTRKPPGDYNGDGKTDLALFRRTSASSAQWFVKGIAALNGHAFGSGTLDVPLTGDIDGDGKTDLLLYRPSTAQWFVAESSTGYTSMQLAKFGAVNLDIPVPGNYSGTGITTVAVYRPTTGQWFLKGQANPQTVTTFQSGDVPVPADYDNVSRDELALYRPGSGQWFIAGPSGTHTITFGGPNDIPMPGACDALTTGTNAVEPAVFRPSTGQFFIHGPSGNRTIQFAKGDIPVAGDFEGVGETEAGVYRPSTGQWFVVGPSDKAPRLLTTYGGPADIPTIAPYSYRALKSGGGSIGAFALGPPIPVALGSSAAHTIPGSLSQTPRSISLAATFVRNRLVPDGIPSRWRFRDGQSSW